MHLEDDHIFGGSPINPNYSSFFRNNSFYARNRMMNSDQKLENANDLDEISRFMVCSQKFKPNQFSDQKSEFNSMKKCDIGIRFTFNCSTYGIGEFGKDNQMQIEKVVRFDDQLQVNGNRS